MVSIYRKAPIFVGQVFKSKIDGQSVCLLSQHSMTKPMPERLAYAVEDEGWLEE